MIFVPKPSYTAKNVKADLSGNYINRSQAKTTFMLNRRLIIVAAITVAVLLSVFAVMSSTAHPKIIELSFDNQSPGHNADELTLRSIRKVGDFYTVDCRGDYEERLQWLNDYHLKKAAELSAPSTCSLFATRTASGGLLLGRNLDRRDIPVLAKFAVAGKYASFAFSPSIEVHLRDVLDVAQPTETQKNNFLFSLPFYPTDGINEKGLAIGIAGVPARRVKHSQTRQPMFVLLFIRRVLDNCQNVEEVARFAETVSLYDRAFDTISHHFLVTDAGRNSLVIDYPDGSLRLTRGQGDPLVRTNHFIEGGPSIADNRTSFSRYDKLYEALNSPKLLASDSEAMVLLKRVCDNTAWSVVYESRARRGLLAVRENYRTQYRFGFPQVKE